MKDPGPNIIVDVAAQTLLLKESGGNVIEYPVSTAANGVGQIMGSECTPLGKHLVRAKIGTGMLPNTVFVGRRPTGEVYSSSMKVKFPQRDWILTRILWLSGLEPSYNRSGDVDTMRRFIYIHGSPAEDDFKVPGSHGCIKMRNSDIIQVFDLVTVGTEVNILSGQSRENETA